MHIKLQDLSFGAMLANWWPMHFLAPCSRKIIRHFVVKLRVRMAVEGRNGSADLRKTSPCWHSRPGCFLLCHRKKDHICGGGLDSALHPLCLAPPQVEPFQD